MDFEVNFNIEKNRFEAILKKSIIGIAQFHFMPGSVLAVTSTKVRSEYEGQGIASAITKALLDYAKSYNYKIKPLCSFTKIFMNSHPEYHSMLAN